MSYDKHFGRRQRSVPFTVHRFVFETFHFIIIIKLFFKRMKMLVRRKCFWHCAQTSNMLHEKHVNNFVNLRFRQISCQLFESTTYTFDIVFAYIDDEIHFRIYASQFSSHLKQSFIVIIRHNLDQTDFCHFLAHAKFFLKIKSVTIDYRLQI